MKRFIPVSLVLAISGTTFAQQLTSQPESVATSSYFSLTNPRSFFQGDDEFVIPLGYKNGDEAVQVFSERMFGFYNADVGRMDVSVSDTFTGFHGQNLFGHSFTLVTSRIDEVTIPAHLDPTGDISAWYWFGTAESPISNGPLASIGLVVQSNSLNQMRFIPLSVLTEERGLAYMLWLEDPENNPLRYSQCNLSPEARAMKRVEFDKFKECVDENHQDAIGEAIFCWLIPGAFCLFPPTSAIGCPGLVLCNAAVTYCTISKDIKANRRYNNVSSCFCTMSQAGSTDFSRCQFECPGCILPPAKYE
jgi:hypothetical protein